MSGARIVRRPHLDGTEMSTVSTPSDDRSVARYIILGAICLSALILPLSFTGAAVARIAIERELGGSVVELTWITNAFMLTFGSLLLAAGAIADEYGRKRVFASGMVIFTLTSILLTVSQSVLFIDILRAVQGIGAAAALAAGSASLAQEFDGRERIRAFSILGATFGVGLAFGPLIAGLLISNFSWRAVFGMIAAVGATSLAFGIPKMRETKNPDAVGMDWPGTLTFSGALGLFTFAVIQAPESGWSNPYVLLSLALSAILLKIFVWVELRSNAPMLDLSLFRFGKFVGVQILPIGTCYSFIVLVVILPLRFMGVHGMSEVEAGWMMVALSAPVLIMPNLAATLTKYLSPGNLCAIGFLIAGVGLVWLSTVGASAPKSAFIAPLILIGIGSGIPWGLMDGLSVMVVPTERAGMASGIFNTSRVASEGISLAIALALLSALAHWKLSEAGVPANALAESSQQLSSGNIRAAHGAVATVGHHGLLSIYGYAFKMTLYMLALVTFAASAVSFGLLRKISTHA